MPARKVSISTSQELYEALEALTEDRGQNRSDLVEMLLREHPMVEREIRRQRRGDHPPTVMPSRSEVELKGLTRAARRQWRKRAAAGEVAFLDR